MLDVAHCTASLNAGFAEPKSPSSMHEFKALHLKDRATEEMEEGGWDKNVILIEAHGSGIKSSS